MRKVCVGILMVLLVSSFVYAQSADVLYSVHMSNVGWGGYSSNGETAGTTGQSRQIEAIKVRVSSAISGGIEYNAHVANVGWVGWSANDAEAGTTGQGRRMEALQVRLTGELANQFDVLYRVHMANVGWGGWSSNGETAGTTGQERRLEAVEIKLQAKAQGAPASSGSLDLGNFPLGKWLDPNWDAVWEFSSNNIRILSPSGRVLWDFAGKTINNFNLSADGLQPVVSFSCPQAGRSYSFKPQANSDLIMDIDRSGQPHYTVTMPKQ